MYCKNCGAQIDNDSRFCNKCGMEQNKANNMNTGFGNAPQNNYAPSPNPYQQQPGQMYRQPPKKNRYIGRLAILAVVLIGVLLILAYIPNPDLDYDIETAEEKNFTPTEYMEMTAEQSEYFNQVLENAQIAQIKNIVFFDELENGGHLYQMDTEYGNPLIVVLDAERNLQEINVKQRDVQIYADGEMKYIYVPKEDRLTYQTATQMLMDEVLISPSSAKYPASSGWTIWEEPGMGIVVKSSVESVNAFNVKVTTEFQFIYVNGNPVSIIIDGEEQLK